MSDLTRPDRGEAVARLDETLADLEPDLALVYCRTALSALGSYAPDVLTFLLDRVDTMLDNLATESAAGRDHG
jgi:hypothetical protein